ncbi:unnamed protein product [Urochloa humidicola]
MENMMAEPADGSPPLTTAEVVYKVLSQNSSTSTTFLKNAGIPKPARSSSEESLRQELGAEKQRSTILLDKIKELKKMSETQERLHEKLKKQQEENLLLLMRLLECRQTGASSQP